MNKNLKLEHDKEKGVVRILSVDCGVVYIIVKNQIKLKNAFVYETNERGRCIGLEVSRKVNLKPFHTCIREFAEEHSIEIIE